MKDGTLQAAVTGGTAPYHYRWSNGASTATVDHLAAGYYRLDVTDANNEVATAEITLEQPLPMKLDVDVYEYSNGYNISCFQCNNGNAAVVVMGGAAPFTVSWSDGPVGANRYNLGPKDYKITVADANGCEGANTTIYLRGPAPSNWGMAGNANTTPGAQFMGTTDNKDVVFKSNGQERLRLKGNGQIGLWGTDTTAGMLYRDYDGTLKIGGGPVLPVLPPNLCTNYFTPFWLTHGNSIGPLCPDVDPPGLGTLTNVPLRLITNNQERMVITTGGRVGIGTTPAQQFDVATADPSGGINITNIRSDANAHTEIRFMKNSSQRWGLGCDLAKNGGQDFFLWDQQANAPRVRVDAQGRVLIGNATPGNSGLYKLYVEGGIVGRDVKVTMQNFPDYVFAPNYSLLPLDELRVHLLRFGHLPGIPSKAEVDAADGVEIGDLQVRMLKVVEEQALYILQLEERLRAVEARLGNQEKGQR